MKQHSNIRKVNILLSQEKYHCWCSNCDDVNVTSEEKGNLYKVYGHEEKREDGRIVLGMYVPVYFTVCKECEFGSL